MKFLILPSLGSANLPTTTTNQFSKQYNMTMTSYLLDRKDLLGKQLYLKPTPHFTIFNKFGKQVYDGEIDNSVSANQESKNVIYYIIEALDKILTNKSI